MFDAYLVTQVLKITLTNIVLLGPNSIMNENKKILRCPYLGTLFYTYFGLTNEIDLRGTAVNTVAYLTP